MHNMNVKMRHGIYNNRHLLFDRPVQSGYVESIMVAGINHSKHPFGLTPKESSSNLEARPFPNAIAVAGSTGIEGYMIGSHHQPGETRDFQYIRASFENAPTVSRADYAENRHL